MTLPSGPRLPLLGPSPRALCRIIKWLCPPACGPSFTSSAASHQKEKTLKRKQLLSELGRCSKTTICNTHTHTQLHCVVLTLTVCCCSTDVRSESPGSRFAISWTLVLWCSIALPGLSQPSVGVGQGPWNPGNTLGKVKVIIQLYSSKLKKVQLLDFLLLFFPVFSMY